MEVFALCYVLCKIPNMAPSLTSPGPLVLFYNNFILENTLSLNTPTDGRTLYFRKQSHGIPNEVRYIINEVYVRASF